MPRFYDQDAEDDGPDEADELDDGGQGDELEDFFRDELEGGERERGA